MLSLLIQYPAIPAFFGLAIAAFLLATLHDMPKARRYNRRSYR